MIASFPWLQSARNWTLSKPSKPPSLSYYVKSNLSSPCGRMLWPHSFLTSALDGNHWLASRHGRFTPSINPSTHWTGRRVAPDPISTVLEKWNNSHPCRNSNPGPSSPYLVAIVTMPSVLLSSQQTLIVHSPVHGSLQVVINLLKPTGHVMHHQFNIQQLYVQPTLYLCVLYLSEKKQRLVPLTA